MCWGKCLFSHGTMLLFIHSVSQRLHLDAPAILPGAPLRLWWKSRVIFTLRATEMEGGGINKVAAANHPPSPPPRHSSTFLEDLGRK